MFHERRAIFVVFVEVVLLVALAGCGGERVTCQGVTCPQYHPEIVNRTDSFEFQVTDVTQVTQTLQFTWNNTGTKANINQASQFMEGTARVFLRDAAGKPVYAGDLRANGTFASTSGESGNWTLQIELTAVSGTLNFRLERGEG